MFHEPMDPAEEDLLLSMQKASQWDSNRAERLTRLWDPILDHR